MSDDQKEQLTSNIANGLKQASTTVQNKMLAQFFATDAEYAERV